VAEQFEISFCLLLLEPYSQRTASAPAREGERDQRDYYKKLQLCIEILFPYLAFLSVTFYCPNSGLRADSGKEQAQPAFGPGEIISVPVHVLGRDLEKCVHCGIFFPKESNITTLY